MPSSSGTNLFTEFLTTALRKAG